MHRTREERDQSELRGSMLYSGIGGALNEEGDMEI